MILRVTAGALALVAANTHNDADELKPLGVDGDFLAFDFGDCDTLDAARESIRSMDVFLAGLIADADDASEIASLSQLKSAVVAIETDVVREYAYKTRAQNDASEASENSARSHYASDTHAAINDSSSSNGAATTDEESNSNDEAQEIPSPSRKSKRG